MSPEGGISDELLDSQMRVEPADTQAPEGFLAASLHDFATVTWEKFGVVILRHHKDIAEIVSRTHRFRATDWAGLLALAKDLTRVTADSIDAVEIHKLLSLPTKERPGSLKSLEKLLAKSIDPDMARTIMTPLVATYELRLADAHLASDRIQESLTLAGLDLDAPTVFQGLQLINNCVASLCAIIDVFQS